MRWGGALTKNPKDLVTYSLQLGPPSKSSEHLKRAPLPEYQMFNAQASGGISHAFIIPSWNTLGFSQINIMHS